MLILPNAISGHSMSRTSMKSAVRLSHFTACASLPPSPMLPKPATHSRYRNTSALPFKAPALKPFPKALRPTHPSITSFTSRSVKAFSPISGLVWSNASRSSATSIWPESSSSKASNAARSSDGGDNGARRLEGRQISRKSDGLGMRGGEVSS